MVLHVISGTTEAGGRLVFMYLVAQVEEGISLDYALSDGPEAVEGLPV
jgi:hypothetical protein